jgi:putative NADH-flavin reductase
MAKLLILGATGATGRHVVARALEAGHELTLLVRNPRRLATVTSDRITILTGSADDVPLLTAAIRADSAVISTLGVGTSLRSGGLIARSSPAIVGAMEAKGARRLIFTSAYGVGNTWRDVPLLPRLLIRLLFRDLYSDKATGEAAIRSSALDWTIIYPVTLTNGPRTGRYRVGERLSLHGFPRISRADVADFILTQLEDCTHVHRGVLISS